MMPTNRLGDWYVNSFSDGRNQQALCVSERTLLPVLLSLPGFQGRLIPAVRWLLEPLNIASEIIESELVAMGGMAVGRTRDRQVLGSMNEMILSADLYSRTRGGSPIFGRQPSISARASADNSSMRRQRKRPSGH
jgi:hypothetical protein